MASGTKFVSDLLATDVSGLAQKKMQKITIVGLKIISLNEMLAGIAFRGPAPSERPDNYREGVRPMPVRLSSG